MGAPNRREMADGDFKASLVSLSFSIH
jgi:hypothetical protein